MSIIIGILAGIICGMGMGGGTLLIPMLVLFLGFDQLNAQSINLVAFLPTAIIALLIQIKSGLVQYKQVWPLALFGLVSAIGGAYLTQIIEPNILKTLFGVFLAGLGIWQLVEIFVNKKKQALKPILKTKKRFSKNTKKLNWLFRIHIEIN